MYGTLSILMNAWLLAGPLFFHEAAHFGWGFFPFVWWMSSVPFMAAGAGLAMLVPLAVSVRRPWIPFAAVFAFAFLAFSAIAIVAYGIRPM